jgi:hypothetical protein
MFEGCAKYFDSGTLMSGTILCKLALSFKALPFHQAISPS